MCLRKRGLYAVHVSHIRAGSHSCHSALQAKELSILKYVAANGSRLDRMSSTVSGLALVIALILVLEGCGNGEQAQNDASGTNEPQKSSAGTTADGGSTTATTATVADDQEFTPIVGRVLDAPIPFAGSDGRTHLVYELEATNFSSGETTVEQLEILDADTDDVLTSLDAEEVAGRLQPAGLREPVETLAPSLTALVFLHVSFDEIDQVPDRLVHRLSLKAAAAPPGQQKITELVGPTEVDRRDVAVVGPPLRGSKYLAADSCCDATRHTRAALPIDGRVWVAQRYAVDYEQLDAESRIYSGKKKDLDSYTIYGQEAIAAADGTVVKVVDGLPEQTPGVFPEGISLEEADGNSVILDIGGGNYALYAHFQPGSIRVQEGHRVKRGDVLALVGNSGNSLAPHLHFHVMSTPQSLASNGLPYEVDSFSVTGRNTAGTEAFDEAEAEGTPLKVSPVDPVERVTDVMPLDQFEVSFD
jgi:murein DD-endopeptidase MepM/ murein hydrolase activator NlpD